MAKVHEQDYYFTITSGSTVNYCTLDTVARCVQQFSYTSQKVKIDRQN